MSKRQSYSSSPPSVQRTPPPTNPTGPYNGGLPKYINDFTKALSAEVRVLLEDVSKLRDERRALQAEIAELMAMKAKHGVGGEYGSKWMPPTDMRSPSPPEEPPLSPTEHTQAPTLAEARPAWRTISKNEKRTPRTSLPGAPHSYSSRSPAISARRSLSPESNGARPPAWTSWRPNSLVHAPVSQPTVSPLRSTPPRGGLFGPSTPPPV